MKIARYTQVGALTLSFLWANVAGAQPDCLSVIPAAHAGSYGSVGPFPPIDRGFYTAGKASGIEYRNWFSFTIPAFPAALVRTELRVPSGRVKSPTGSETYELHQFSGSISNLINYTGNYSNTFLAL